MGVLQHSTSLPWNTHSSMFYQAATRTQAWFHACAAQLCTTSSVHALHVRDRRFLRALTGYGLRLDSSQSTFYLYTCQLLCVFIQSHPRGGRRNVSLKSTLLLAHMLSLRLPPQLPLARPSWDPSTPVGIHRHICGYLPFTLSLLSQKITSTVLLQITDTWSIFAAQDEGGAICILVLGLHIKIHFV